MDGTKHLLRLREIGPIERRPKRLRSSNPAMTWVGGVELFTSQRVLWMGVLALVLSVAVIRFSPGGLRVPVAADPELMYETAQEQRFIETNSSAPMNEPDEADFYAARSQQAAQPEERLDLDIGAMPLMEGTQEMSQAIIKGDLEQPEPAVYQTASQERKHQEEAQPKAAEASQGQALPDLMQKAAKDTDEDGIFLDSKVAVMPREAGNEQARRVQIVQVDANMREAIKEAQAPSKAQMQSRPQVRPRAIPAPLLKSHTRAPRLGAVAVDAQFSDFGEYEQRMLEAISRQWHILARNFPLSPSDQNSYVQMRFAFDNEGNVAALEVEETTAGEMAQLLCTDAVASRAPYGPWSEAMKEVFGVSKEIRITFFYQ